MELNNNNQEVEEAVYLMLQKTIVKCISVSNYLNLHCRYIYCKLYVQVRLYLTSFIIHLNAEMGALNRVSL